MSAWPCGENPPPGATRSSLITRKRAEAHVRVVVVLRRRKSCGGCRASRNWLGRGLPIF